MNTSSEAAESIVKMSLEGLEVIAKLTGNGSKNVAVMLYAVMKDQKQTKGKTTLVKMLKSGKPLKIFSLKQEDLKKFAQESKRYGVLYSLLVDKRNLSPDGIVDIMVREDDASKINRIVERFKLSTTDKAQVESIIEKAKIDKVIEEAKEKGVEIKTIDNTKSMGEKNRNPQAEKSEIDPPSDLSLNSKNKVEGNTISKNKRPSVRAKLRKLTEQVSKQKEQRSQSRVYSKKNKIRIHERSSR